MSASEADILRSSIRAVGIELNTVFDLVNSRRSYRAAIPILIAALEKGIADAGLKEAVVRALGAREARGTEAGRVLIREYWRLPCEEEVLRWTIGNTIAIIADESVFQEVASIVVDHTNGKSREMFVLSLGRIKTKEARKLLVQLLDDNQVASHALDALGKLKATEARAKVEALTKHPKPLIRREAAKALKLIGGARSQP